MNAITMVYVVVVTTKYSLNWYLVNIAEVTVLSRIKIGAISV